MPAVADAVRQNDEGAFPGHVVSEGVPAMLKCSGMMSSVRFINVVNYKLVILTCCVNDPPSALTPITDDRAPWRRHPSTANTLRLTWAASPSTTTAAAMVVTGVLIVFSSVDQFAKRASNGMSARASGLPQPVTGSQPGPPDSQ